MIFLRPLYKFDIDRLFEMKNNPKIFNKKFTNIDCSAITIESINEWFNNFVNETNTIRFGICLYDSNILIGSITLGNVDYNIHSCELNIYIDNAYHGNGYGYNALTLIINYCKNILKFNKINLAVHNNNLIAIKLYNKVNFQITKKTNDFLYMTLYL